MSSSQKTSIVLIDDHPMITVGISAFIDHQKDMHVVGTADNKLDATKLLIREKPCIAIIDIVLGNEDGLQLVRTMKNTSPGTRSLVMTSYNDRNYIRSSITAGAHGFALKSAMSGEILNAIRRVAGGDTYLDPALGSTTWETYKNVTHHEQLIATLSPRERRVFELVAKGETHHSVAESLGIGKKAVDIYRARLYQKLNITTRAEMMQMALSLGVITVPPVQLVQQSRLIEDEDDDEDEAG